MSHPSKHPSLKVAPSLIAADAARLADEVAAVETAGADLLHMDVMDGRFVPNITFGPWVHQAVHQASKLQLDTHLMIVEPDHYLEAFIDAGAATLTVQVEACLHLHRTLQQIRKLGARAGITLNPGTSLTTIEPVLADVDHVLVMGVNPGFAGQPFIPATIERTRCVDTWRRERKLDFTIGVDGGVGPGNAHALHAAGADILVAGSAVFKSNDYRTAIDALRL